MFRRRDRDSYNLRAKALRKLTQVYVSQVETTTRNEASQTKNGLDIILSSLPTSYSSRITHLYTIPLTLNEWEILTAICGTEPESADQVTKLLNDVVSRYFLDSPRQRISDVLLARFRLANFKNPNEVLTFQLTKFLITICRRFPEFIDTCLSLLDQYLSLVAELFTKKQSSLFSLTGLMNAFIRNNSSLELMEFVWRKLRDMFYTNGLIQQLETVLTTSTTFTNDSIVRYFNAGQEISGPFFSNLLAELQVSIACRILQIENIPYSLTNYLLGEQNKYFQQQHTLSSPEELALRGLEPPPSVSKRLESHRELITDMCSFASKMFSDIDEAPYGFSTTSRARSSFNAKAHFIQLLCLIPFFVNYESPLMRNFTELVGAAVEKFLLSEVVTFSLVKSILSVSSLMNFFTEELSDSFLRCFPILVGSEYLSRSSIVDLSKIYTLGLQPLNEDSIVSTIYSINNLLTARDSEMATAFMRERQLTMSSNATLQFPVHHKDPLHKLKEVTSQVLNAFETRSRKSDPGHEDAPLERTEPVSPKSENTGAIKIHRRLFENCVAAATTIAAHYNKQTITALTISILTQKVGVFANELDEIILNSLADLSPFVLPSELSMSVKFFKSHYAYAMKHGKDELARAIIEAKTKVSRTLAPLRDPSNELFRLYLINLLDRIVSKGEVEDIGHHRPHQEISRVAEEISVLLKPLAALLPPPGTPPLDISKDEVLTKLFRNMWFNMTVHGFYYSSDLVKNNYKDLLTIVHNSPPLTSDFPANNQEISLEMNTILRRGSSNSNIKQQKQLISEYLNTNAVQARTLSNTKIMFLASTILLETIRCEAGDCSKILLYLSDTSLNNTPMDRAISSMATAMVKKYVRMVEIGKLDLFNSQSVARQLNNMLLCLVNKNTFLQNAAFQCCDIFIRNIPSSLCHHRSLFTLLDMLTTTFDSIIDCQTNRYDPHYKFVLKHSQIEVLFPDSESWRKNVLNRLCKAADEWVKIILDISNQDTKILLQSYVSDLNQGSRIRGIEFGVSFALEMAGYVVKANNDLLKFAYHSPIRPSTISGFISQYSWRSKFLVDTAISSSTEDIFHNITAHVEKIRSALSLGKSVLVKDITDFLDLAAALLILGNMRASSLIFDIVHVPFEVFTPEALENATNVWLTIIKERTDLAPILLADVCFCWLRSIREGTGLYSSQFDLPPDGEKKMEYAPYDKVAINKSACIALRNLKPHRRVIKFFMSHFEGTLYQSDSLLRVFNESVLYGLLNLRKASLHPFARLIRNELLLFGLAILDINYKQRTEYVKKLCLAIVDGGLSWFTRPVSWPFGGNEMKINTDIDVMLELRSKLDAVKGIMKRYCDRDFDLLYCFLSHEIYCAQTWLNPLSKIDSLYANDLPEFLVETAFKKDPCLAVNLVNRFRKEKQVQLLSSLIYQNALSCAGVSDALDYFLAGFDRSASKKDLYAIVYWSPVDPLKSINLFLPHRNGNSFILQYSIYSLESHDVNITFFYVPQIVQCLRYDQTGYVERLIMDTAKIDVLFSHQIIWNMLANCYKDDEGVIEDEIKPTLDRIREKMIATFSGSHREFYEREFSFFNKVTGISGKLKPYIKKSKAEKKQKIDEEMKKIVVKPGVYLPSNPDGVVIDINRTSGKPLQSHAKAPFMATFKIKKDVFDPDTQEYVSVEKWQAAIFKVGDDCRQDVLALQIISIFRTIWSSIGLDVFVFPYRVTATAPGCGVIDVLPNSVSRDMLGREAVNGLYEYFTSKFGPEATIEFQNARNNFLKSLAGYSVISYLLQFKDRHNGNIMYDDQGHCLHIDFGFIFDIVPGGVKFEAVPFKLTAEMVKVMGGSDDTPAYHKFEELCIKAYLAARPHMDIIIGCVEPMLGSGLPCFKGTKTIKNLRARFQPEKTDREAAQHMKALIKRSYESFFTRGYDEFQRLTNGIPY